MIKWEITTWIIITADQLVPHKISKKSGNITANGVHLFHLSQHCLLFKIGHIRPWVLITEIQTALETLKYFNNAQLPINE